MSANMNATMLPPIRGPLLPGLLAQLSRTEAIESMRDFSGHLHRHRDFGTNAIATVELDDLHLISRNMAAVFNFVFENAALRELEVIPDVSIVCELLAAAQWIIGLRHLDHIIIQRSEINLLRISRASKSGPSHSGASTCDDGVLEGSLLYVSVEDIAVAMQKTQSNRQSSELSRGFSFGAWGTAAVVVAIYFLRW